MSGKKKKNISSIALTEEEWNQFASAVNETIEQTCGDEDDVVNKIHILIEITNTDRLRLGAKISYEYSSHQVRDVEWE